MNRRNQLPIFSELTAGLSSSMIPISLHLPPIMQFNSSNEPTGLTCADGDLRSCYMIPAEHTQNTPSSGSLPIAISVISSSSPSAEFKERPAPGPYMNPIQPGSWFDSIPATPKLETENRSLHLGQIAIDESDGSTQVPFTVRDSPSDSATTSDSGSDEGTNSQGITGIARLEIIKRYISKRWAKTATDLGSNFPPVPTASQVGDMASSLRMNEAHKYLWNNPTELVRLGSPNRKIVVVGGDVLKILGIPDQLAKALRADLLAADDSEDGVRSILEVPPSNRQCPYNSRCRTILPWSDTHKMRHLLMHLKQHGVHIKACCPCCGWLLSRSDALFAREHWRDLEIRCRGSSLKPSTWSCYTVQSVMTNVNRYLRVDDIESLYATHAAIRNMAEEQIIKGIRGIHFVPPAQVGKEC